MVELEPFTAADVFAENKIVPSMGMITGSRDAIREKCKLSSSSTRHFYFMDLHGVGKPGAYEHFSSLRMPGKNGCAAKLRIAIRPLGDHRWNGRNALNEEILAWFQRRRPSGLLGAG